jgi:hypothetical protein
LIELIRTGAPEALVDRVVTEKKAQEQIAAIIQSMFIGYIP